MNNHQHPPPSPTGHIAIQDVFALYALLAQVTNPTENCTQAKANLETVILAFTQSLGPNTGAPHQ